MSIHRKFRRPGQVRPARSGFNAAVEAFEKRELLTTVAPFIQGTAFIDSSATGTLTPTDVPLANATISLYQGAASTLTANSPVYETTTTKSDGGYVFNTGLTVGATYTVVESAAGYTSTAAQAVSQIDPATVIAPNEIQVTVVDPNAVNATFTGPVTPFNNIYYTQGTTSSSTVPTQLMFKLGGAANVNTSTYNSMCVGLNDPLNSSTYSGVIDPQSALASNGGEIAYLYNQYGVSLPNVASLPAGLQDLPTKDLISGVQLAIWSLEYGSSFSVTGYDPTYTTAADYADIQTAMTGFLNDAQGKSEKVAIIDSSLTGSLPAPSATVGGQSVLAGESLNFGNKVAPPTSSLGGAVYIDNNANDTLDTGDAGLGGITVSLENSSGTVLGTTTTSSTGAYSFTGLAAGTYSVVETQPAGYTVENGDAGTSAGTPGIGSVTSISLAASTNATGYNLGQYQLGTITGLAYFDATNSGSYVSGETTIPGVTVKLVNGAGTTVATTTTGTGGTYSFTSVVPGTYKVTESNVPAGYSPDKTNTGSISSIVITSGSTSSNNNFGEIGGASISGTKYEDTTGNGLSCSQSPLTGDVPQPGVTIDLFTANPLALVASTVTAANGTYSFTGLPYGTYDVAEAVPSGQIQTGPTVVTGPTCTTTLSDCGFEQISEGSGWYSYAYNPTGSAWSFSGDSGVTGNGSAFTAGNPCAPYGNQVAFVQCQGSISQVVSNWTAGNYQLSLSAAERANYGACENFEILCDGNVVGTFTPTSPSYQTCVTPSFYVGSGSHTITIQGLDSCGTDATDFIDNVCIVQHSGQVVEEGNGQAYYSINLAACSPTSTNNNFSDYAACDTSAITNISYKVSSTTNNCWGGTTTTSNTYSSLSGNTSPGDTVSATFTVSGSSDQMVSLVSYIVPYGGAPLSSQIEYSLDTGEFTPGTHTVTVTLPTSAYQVDFVCGAAISHFGQSGTNVTYHGEGRFFSSDSEGCGCTCYVTPPLANVQSDIGAVNTPGTLSYDNGSYTLTASGSDFWGTADSGNYVYQTLNGNGEIVARVDGISDTDCWAKAGLMIRQSLDPGSPQASVFATAGNGVVFQDRETEGAQSNSWSASNSYGCNSNTAVFLKLVREGNTITGYDSSNGVCWTEVGSDTITMSQPVYIGLAATAHNNCAVATATFDDVSTSGYWASCSGQSLIQSFGGWSGSTCLSSWLAQNYSSLYGSGAGCNNLWGLSNTGVAAFCLSLEAQYGCESLECQTLSTAIDEYASNWGLGGSVACNWGFNCNNSVASQWENTSGSCSAFGTTTCDPWATVGSLLSFENSEASCGSLYFGNTTNHQLACNVIYQVGGCF